MPNSFNTDNGNRGILENNRLYKETGGMYYIPSDWSIWLVYNPKMGGGKIRFKTRMEEFNEDDKGRIAEGGTW